MIERWLSAWRAHPLAAALFLVALSACGRGSDLPGEMRGGFLPIPTMTPASTEEPRVYFSIEPGDDVNVYEEFLLAGVTSIQVIERGFTTWVLDRIAVREILTQLDTGVQLEAWDSPVERPLVLIAHWPHGRGLDIQFGLLDRLDLIVDETAATIAAGAVGSRVAFPMPDGFLELARASALDITPTLTPTDTPTPTPTLRPTSTPTITPANVVFFDHPEGELRWDGPDDRVTSRDRAHCGPDREVTETHGIPALISVADEYGFWFGRFVPLDDGWEWTGYHHDGWQIWQGDEPRLVYLVHPEQRGLAFEYESFGCF